MLDDHPQELGLAFGKELPDQLIVISLEIAQSQFYSLLVDVTQLADGLIVKVELARLEIFLADEEVSKIGEILEEGALHECDLVVDAGQLGDLVDEVQKGLRNTHYLVVHYLEQFSEQQGGCLDKIYGVGFLLGYLGVIGLA